MQAEFRPPEAACRALDHLCGRPDGPPELRVGQRVKRALEHGSGQFRLQPHRGCQGVLQFMKVIEHS